MESVIVRFPGVESIGLPSGEMELVVCGQDREVAFCGKFRIESAVPVRMAAALLALEKIAEQFALEIGFTFLGREKIELEAKIGTTKLEEARQLAESLCY